MILLKMAVRNVFRNRRRSIITLTAIACGIFTLVTMRGMLNGMGRQSEMNLIDLQYGHMQVFNQDYYENPAASVKDSIEDPEKIIRALKDVDHVTAGVERLIVPSMVNFDGNDLTCLSIGIDLGQDEKVFKLKPTVVEGQGEYLTEGPHAMVGERMARTLGLKKGDRIVWKARAMGKEGGGSIQAVYLEVTGIISTGNPAIDGAALFIPLDFMQESLLAKGRASQVAIRIDDPRYLERAFLSAQRVLKPMGFEVKTWEEMGKAFLELHRMKKIGNGIMIGVFLLIIMVGIVNTMLMATFERVREIGMLMALGMKAAGIRTLFLLEGAMLGLMGSTIGVVLATPAVWAMEKYGIPIDIFTGGKDVDMGYPIRGVMYGDLSLELIIWSLLIGVLISTAATLLPAWRASRMEPTEALRHA